VADGGFDGASGIADDQAAAGREAPADGDRDRPFAGLRPDDDADRGQRAGRLEIGKDEAARLEQPRVGRRDPPELRIGAEAAGQPDRQGRAGWGRGIGGRGA
jgi:hypothetical protein